MATHYNLIWYRGLGILLTITWSEILKRWMMNDMEACFLSCENIRTGYSLDSGGGGCFIGL